MTVPNDVRKALEEAGVKFDNNGNIIEDENETFLGLAEDSDDDDQDDQDYQDDQDDDDDLEEDDDEGDDDESDDTDDDSEEDDDNDDEDDDDEDEEVEDKSKSKKRKPKAKKPKDKQDDDDDDELPKLTPKQLQKQKDDSEEAMSEIRKNLKALLEKGNDFKSKKDVNDDDDTQSALRDLRREAEEFRKLRFQTFAANIKDRVKQSNFGADFDDIINSTQWEEFLNKKAYGSRIGDLYRNAIQSQDADSVLFFFDDFASRYLQKPSKEKGSVNKQKDDLDDLAVPDKTKTSRSPKKRRKYDFEENDYITKLDEAERGIITREEFVKFSDAFESALSKGRVKKS